MLSAEPAGSTRVPVWRRLNIPKWDATVSTSLGSSGQYDRYPTLIQQNTLNNNMGNRRLPPYPHPTTVHPAYQVKQPLNVVLNPVNKNQSPSHSPTGFDKFCRPRLCVIGSPKLDDERRDLYDLPGLTRQDSKDSLSSEHSSKDDTDEQWLC